MINKYIKCILLFYGVMNFLAATAQDSAAPAVDTRYIGNWNGTWVEGMSSGNATLSITENGGQFAFTALPAFGRDPAAINKIKGTAGQLSFHVIGADGRVMRFELMPLSEFKKLKGKAHYDGLHMEVELFRTP